MWERIADIINEGKKFIITTHLFSEGDAIGSELAPMPEQEKVKL